MKVENTPLTTMIVSVPKPAAARWLYRWAVLTVGVTVVALVSGAVVTTFRVGMADPIWPTYPWHLLLISWQEPSAGFLIEHGHRLADYTLGCCVIVLALWLWFGERRLWMRWLGVAALAGVVLQGLLGGFRVKLHELAGTDLAFLHGCFGQVVFGLLVCLAVFTSPEQGRVFAPAESAGALGCLRWFSLATAALVYLQLVLGGLVRHTNSAVGRRGHMVVAFAVVAAIVWLTALAWQNPAAKKHVAGAVILLAGLVACQVLLGVEAWMVRFSAGLVPDFQPVTVQQGAVRTAHFILGSLVFGQAVVLALKTRQPVVESAQVPLAPAGRLEGAA
jgi:cytochrome c oxidase assembly protein subunit 15